MRRRALLSLVILLFFLCLVLSAHVVKKKQQKQNSPQKTAEERKKQEQKNKEDKKKKEELFKLEHPEPPFFRDSFLDLLKDKENLGLGYSNGVPFDFHHPLEIITLSTTLESRVHNSIQNLFKSAAKMGVRCMAIGIGTKWEGKIKAMRALLSHLPPNRMIMFLDATDVALLPCTVEEILRKYRSYNTTILFSAEANPFPPELKDYADSYPLETGNSRMQYLNSGGYIGPAGALRQAWKVAAQFVTEEWTKRKSDQGPMTMYFLELLEEDMDQNFMKLDTNVEIFLTLHQVKPEEVDFKSILRPMFNRTGTSPCVLHGAGIDGKRLLPKVMKQMCNETKLYC